MDKLGILYYKIGEYSKALELFTGVLKIAMAHYENDKKPIGVSLRYIAKIYQAMNQIDKAIDTLKGSLHILELQKDPELEHILVKIGDYYSGLKKYAEAGEFYEKAASLSENPEERMKELRKKLLSIMARSYQIFPETHLRHLHN